MENVFDIKEKKKHAWFLWENVKERDHLKEISIDGRIQEWFSEE
jgi:hypothetical protein